MGSCNLKLLLWTVLLLGGMVNAQSWIRPSSNFHSEVYSTSCGHTAWTNPGNGIDTSTSTYAINSAGGSYCPYTDSISYVLNASYKQVSGIQIKSNNSGSCTITVGLNSSATGQVNKCSFTINQTQRVQNCTFTDNTSYDHIYYTVGAYDSNCKDSRLYDLQYLTYLAPGATQSPCGYNASDTNYTGLVYAYNVSFRREDTDVIYNFNGTSSYLTFYCQAPYEGFPIAIDASNTSYLVLTKTPANLFAQVNSGLSRTMDTSGNWTGTMYLPWWNGTTYSYYAPVLRDFSGGMWYGAQVTLDTNVNMTMVTVINDTFQLTDNRAPMYLINNSRYHMYITKNNVVYDLGFIRADPVTPIPSEVDIGVPPHNLVYTDDGISYQWTQDYDTNQVGAYVSSLYFPVNALFNVYNATSTGYVLTYSSNMTGGVINYAYTVPNRNMSYYLRLYINGAQPYERMVLLYNSSNMMNESVLNRPLPAQILGMATQTWKKLAVVLFCWFIVYTMCKATNYGIGAMVAVLAYAFGWSIWWVPQTEVPFVILPIFGLMAFLLIRHERRSG